jgi:hypothetical protein
VQVPYLLLQNFSLYDAQNFKRIALTINKSLKKSKANVATWNCFIRNLLGRVMHRAHLGALLTFPSLQFIINQNAGT